MDTIINIILITCCIAAATLIMNELLPSKKNSSGPTKEQLLEFESLRSQVKIQRCWIINLQTGMKNLHEQVKAMDRALRKNGHE